MKKFLSMVMALMLVMTVLPMGMLTANAEDADAVITISDAEGMAGSTVEVTVSIASTAAINSMGFALDYDKDVLTFTEVKAYGPIAEKNMLGGTEYVFDATQETVFVALATAEAVNGDIITFVFEIDEEATGTAEIGADDVILKKDATPYTASVEKGTVTVKEAPKQDFDLTFSDAEYDYDGEEKSILVEGDVPEGANVAYENNKGTNAGTYNAKVTVTKKGYNDFVKEAVLTINKIDVTVEGYKAEDKTYDGTKTATLTKGALVGAVEGDEVSVIWPETAEFASADAGKNIAVTAAELALDGADKDNYVLTQPEALKAEIKKAPITITADSQTLVVGDEIKLTYKVEGTVYAEGDITGELETEATGAEAGEFAIEQGSLTATDNYELTFVPGTLKIEALPLQDIEINKTVLDGKTYGDADFTLPVTEGEKKSDAPLVYASSNEAVATIDANGLIKILAAGETTITVTKAGKEGELADFASEPMKLVVAKKAVTVDSVNLTTKTATLGGVVDGDTIAVDFTAVKLEIGDDVDDTTSNATVKNFVLTGDKAANYEVKTESVATTVAKEKVKTVTVTTHNGNADGDTTGGGTIEGTGAYLDGANVTLKAVADSGYQFDGWYNGEQLVSTDAEYTLTGINATVALTAKFKRVSTGNVSSGGGSSMCLVKFETNGGSKVTSRKFAYNETLGYIADPVKEGYIFGGWYTDEELTKEFTEKSKIKKSMTLYAAWKNADGTEDKKEDTTEDKKAIILTIGEVDATVFGEKKANDVAPLIKNDRTMLPARFVAEALGATVTWNDEKREVTIEKDELKIVITIDSDKAIVNGEEVALDSPAFIENDRTYTPIRFISENLGAEVTWDEEAQKVTISVK